MTKIQRIHQRNTLKLSQRKQQQENLLCKVEKTIFKRIESIYTQQHGHSAQTPIFTDKINVRLNALASSRSFAMCPSACSSTNAYTNKQTNNQIQNDIRSRDNSLISTIYNMHCLYSFWFILSAQDIRTHPQFYLMRRLFDVLMLVHTSIYCCLNNS